MPLILEGMSNKMSRTVIAFDNDGVLRDESVSYSRCIIETVAFFDGGKEATGKEMIESMKESNDDWERTFNILKYRGIKINFSAVKEYFQDLYLGRERDFTGYINDEIWLADNKLLKELSRIYDLVIISGAPKEEILYNLKRNNAADYFKLILGMNDCSDKFDGMTKVRNIFNPDRIFFCDDRPSPLKILEAIKKDFKLNTFGILPPKSDEGWGSILTEAGAERIFNNVNEYCQFILNNN